jgi:hypothetical protein
MSLTQDDLQQIGALFDDKLDRKLVPIINELKALREDIKEIYAMITELQASTITDSKFSKKSLEDKLLTLNAELLAAAKQAGVTLPRG